MVNLEKYYPQPSDFNFQKWLIEVGFELVNQGVGEDGVPYFFYAGRDKLDMTIYVYFQPPKYLAETLGSVIAYESGITDFKSLTELLKYKGSDEDAGDFYVNEAIEFVEPPTEEFAGAIFVNSFFSFEYEDLGFGSQYADESDFE